MKRKIIKLLARIRRSKFFKIFFSSLVIISVLISCFTVSSFAVDFPSVEFNEGGYMINMAQIKSTPNLDITYPVSFMSGNIRFDSFRIVTDEVGYPYIYYGSRLVYDEYNWFSQADPYGNHPEFAFMFFDYDQTITSPPPSALVLFETYFDRMTGFDYINFDGAKWYGVYDGAILGYENGYDVGYSEGETFGYNQGYFDGLNSADSDNFGQNLIGDTLSAPFRAMNNFVIFTAPNGTDITLGYVFGGMLALILFLGFLKLFAGG